MHDPAGYVRFHLDRLREENADDAFHRLIEADSTVIPYLIAAFDWPENRGIRAQIVECLWQQRSIECIPFLARVLCDPDMEVWQQALDGLVCIGGPQALAALQAARQQINRGAIHNDLTTAWIDEAVEQIRTA